ncbi:MAG: ABC transporter substrate-binding protein [Planctomycetota bacterium]
MRIASLTCSNTEIVCALGCGDRLVAVDDHSDHPAETLAGLPRLGPDLQIDIDRLVVCEPDLVLASLTVPGHEAVVEAVEAAGLTSIAPAPERLEDIERDIREIGALLEVEARAEALVASMADELAVIEAAIPPGAPIPILVEWWPKPVIVPGARSWVTDLLARVGGVNPFGERDAKSLPIEPAEAEAAGAAAIAISWCGVEERNYRPEKVWGRAGWERVPAVRDRRVAPISEAYLGRPGPRVVEGARRLAALVAECRSGDPRE